MAPALAGGGKPVVLVGPLSRDDSRPIASVTSSRAPGGGVWSRITGTSPVSSAIPRSEDPHSMQNF